MPVVYSSVQHICFSATTTTDVLMPMLQNIYYIYNAKIHCHCSSPISGLHYRHKARISFFEVWIPGQGLSVCCLHILPIPAIKNTCSLSALDQGVELELGDVAPWLTTAPTTWDGLNFTAQISLYQ